MVTGKTTKRAELLLDSIRKQLNGNKLPKLQKLEGARLMVEARGGKLNWRIVQSSDAESLVEIHDGRLAVSHVTIPSLPTW